MSNTGKHKSWAKERLEALVEEATVDAYGESEQATGFYTMMENDLRLPFETEILNVTVAVTGIDISDDDEIVAVCKRGEKEQRISIDELPLPEPQPEGAEWIAAYKYWKGGFR